MQRQHSIDRALASAPRAPLAHLPTPLERLERLGAEVGHPSLWIKRDDCTGLAAGGNKTRKLEFLLGRAIADGADGIVTFGALQSNHARQTAAACARAGLPCDLVLTRTVDRPDEAYERSGNVLLDRLLGARVHVADDADAVMTLVGELEARAAADGRTLAFIPPGGSDPTGTLGYVAAGRELADQLAEAGIDGARVVVAASTCGTAAGLVLSGVGSSVDVACVYRDAGHTSDELRALIEATASDLGVDASGTPHVVTDDQLGAGYGIETDASRRAIELLARTEGILLDPVYTAKAFASLIERAAELRDEHIVFLHTGGMPGLFAYA